MSKSDIVMSCYSGKAIEIGYIDASNEVDYNLIDDNAILNLTIGERQELWTSLIDNEEVKKLQQEFIEEDEELTLNIRVKKLHLL